MIVILFLWKIYLNLASLFKSCIVHHQLEDIKCQQPRLVKYIYQLYIIFYDLTINIQTPGNMNTARALRSIHIARHMEAASSKRKTDQFSSLLLHLKVNAALYKMTLISMCVNIHENPKDLITSLSRICQSSAVVCVNIRY